MSSPFNATIIWLTFRQLFARRRLWVAVGFATVPLLVTLLFRMLTEGDDTARDFLIGLNREIIVGAMLPIIALVFGTGAFGSEIDDGTVVYLLVKPVPRWHVVISKFVVVAVASIGTILLALALPWLVLRGPDVPWLLLLSFGAGATLGAVLYGALFTWLGLVTKRALVVGLVYAIGMEQVLSRTLPGVRSLSVREFTLSVTHRVGAELQYEWTPVDASTVWTMAGVILAGALLAAVARLQKYEMAERL
jgi:ABC-2 type transport system permease protein